MTIELEPPDSAAGIRIGATRDEARRQCRVHGDPQPFRRADEATESLVVHRESGMPVFVYLDADDRVEAVELGRPEGEDPVTFRGIDVFGAPADEVVDALREHTPVTVSEEGHSVTAPQLLLALWRSVVPEDADEPEGRHFESVLVARPGYGG